MTNTARYGLGSVDSNSSQKEVVINADSFLIDLFMGPEVLSRTVTTPPGSPAYGDMYLTPASGLASGTAWTAYPNKFVAWDGSAWQVITPPDGIRVYVKDVTTNTQLRTGTWTDESSSTARAAWATSTATLTWTATTTTPSGTTTIYFTWQKIGNYCFFNIEISAAVAGVLVTGLTLDLMAGMPTPVPSPGATANGDVISLINGALGSNATNVSSTARSALTVQSGSATGYQFVLSGASASATVAYLTGSYPC